MVRVTAFDSCGVSLMRHVSYAGLGITSPQSASHSSQKTKRTSIFASVVAALDLSRRLQARRILRQYEHLIVPPKGGPRDSNQRIGGDGNVGN
jgi:AICAR transformylase/IMP cyclohydrolase PurH